MMEEQKNSAGLKLAILSLSLLTIMAAAAVSPALGKIREAFPDVSKTTIQMTLTLPALLIIPFSLLAGWLATKRSPRRMLVTGLVIFCVGGVGGGFAQTIGQLLLFRAILGVGVGLIMPLSHSLIADLFEGEERTKIMGLSGSVSHLGGVLFLLLSGWLACLSWRLAFGVYALGLLSLVLVLLWLPQGEKKQARASGAFRLSAPTWYCAGLGALMMIAFYAAPTNMAMFINEEELIVASQVPLLQSREELKESLERGRIPERARQNLASMGVKFRGDVVKVYEDPAKPASRRWYLEGERKRVLVKRTEDALLVCDERIGRPALAGFALSTMTLIGVVSGLALSVCGKLMGRWFGPATIAMMAAGFWLFSLAQSMAMVFAGAVLIGLASGFMMPLLLLKISAAVTPVTRAFAMAFLSAGVYLGQFISPVVLEQAAAALGRTSIRSQFELLAAALGVATLVGFGIVGVKRPVPAVQQEGSHHA
jgi:MFS family permease